MPRKLVYRKGKRKDYRKAYGEYPAIKGYNKTVYGRNYNKPPFRSVNSYGQRPWPFPMRLKAQMPYTYSGQLACNTVSVGTFGNEHVYRLNSIYDPDFTGLGKTVIGWNIMDEIYRNYIVHAVKIEILFRDPTTDGGVVGCTYCQDDTSGVIQNKILETVNRHPQTYTSSLNNSGTQKKRFSFYVRPWALEGLSHMEWLANKTSRSSEMSSSPSDDIFFRVAYMNDRSTTDTIQYDLKIIYYTEFFNRKIAVPNTF